MCPQTVGLISAACERRGISTVAVQPFRHVAERVRPPRGLLVPYPLGHPLGRPNDAEGQHAVLDAMLSLLEREQGPGPVLAQFIERG